MGRWRGGLTTKLHLLAEGRGRSLVKRVTPGQAADTRELVPLLDNVAVARPGGRGARVRPARHRPAAAIPLSPTGSRAGAPASTSARQIPEETVGLWPRDGSNGPDLVVSLTWTRLRRAGPPRRSSSVGRCGAGEGKQDGLPDGGAGEHHQQPVHAHT
jgi:hypothetical protein